jgi:predicted RNA polymerase sigma factor
MKEFLLVYRADYQTYPNSSPDEMQATTQKWMNWIGSIAAQDKLSERLGTVLKTLYLLFNEGYFSKTHDQLVRKDLCSEAMRLTLILTDNPLTSTPKAYALLALMCFQSSRLNARIDEKGEVILLDQQDENLWDRALIEKGNNYLATACTGNELSKYHLEAGIAYWHTTQAGKGKWENILVLYNQLIVVEYSPAIALNRAFAYYKVYGQEDGIAEAKKLGLEEHAYYHSLLGYMYAETNIDKAIFHYDEAVERTGSRIEKQILVKEIDRLIEKERIV